VIWTSGGIKNSRENFKRLAGKCGSISNMIRTHSYAHPQHMKIVKPYMYLILMWESSWMSLSSTTTLWCDLTLWRKPELKLPSKSLAKAPAHLPKYTSIKHQHFGSDYGAAAIHRQRQTIHHHQAIANTPIIKKIAWELAKIHPIKREPPPTPSKIHLN